MSGLDFFDDGKVPMDNITIPPAALEAAARAAYAIWVKQCWGMGIEDTDQFQSWEDLPPEDRQNWLDQHRGACLAMLKNWPGMDHISGWQTIGGWRNACIILPLTEKD
jgi:hypothetical protein